MAAYALGLMRQRAREAFAQKIRRGPVMWEVPVGCVRTEDHRLEKSADRQVQQALDGVCKQLRALGSARQTMLWYRDAQLPLPAVHPGTAGHDIRWQLPSGHRMHQMLTNPCSAGALVSGRPEAKTVIEAGRARQSTRRKKPLEQWRLGLLEPHPGSSSWDMFLQNQPLLEAKRARPKDAAGGAAKRGMALLSGLLRCGRCGRKLQVVSSGTTGRVPRDGCRGGRVDRGSSSCVPVGGLRVDQAVKAAVLEALQPAGVQAACMALDHVETAHDTQRQALA